MTKLIKNGKIWEPIQNPCSEVFLSSKEAVTFAKEYECRFIPEENIQWKLDHIKTQNKINQHFNILPNINEQNQKASYELI